MVTDNHTVFMPSEAAVVGLADLQVSEISSLPRVPYKWVTSVQRT